MATGSSNDEVNVQFKASMDDLIAGLSTGVSELTKTFEALTSRAEELGKAFQEGVGKNAEDASEKVSKVSHEAGNVGEALEEVKGKINRAFEATGILIVYESLKKVFEQIEKIADNAERVLNVSLSFKATTQELQGLESITARTGGSVELLQRVMAQLQNTLTDARRGTQEARDKLSDFGISAEQLKNPAFTVVDAMVQIAQAGKSDAEVLDLVGARAVAILPTFRELKGGLEAVYKANSDVGSLNKEQLKVLEEFKGKVETLDLRWENFKGRILIEVLPTLDKLIAKLNEVSGATEKQDKIASFIGRTLDGISNALGAAFDIAMTPFKAFDAVKGALGFKPPETKSNASPGHGEIGEREPRPDPGPLPKEDPSIAAARIAAQRREMAAQIEAIDQRQHEVTRQLNEENLNDFAREQQVMLERKRDSVLGQIALDADRVKQQLSLGVISIEEAVAQEDALALRKYQVQVTYYDKVKALVAMHQADVDKAENEIAKAAQQRGLEMQRNQGELAQGIQRRWMEILTPIGQAFDESIKGMIRGTLTFTNAMRNMGQSIVLEFVSMCVKMLTKWVATEIAKTSATVVGQTARSAAEQAGHKQGLAASAASAIKEIANSAYVTMANVYRSVSAIPYVGWILAPIAAVAAGAAVLAFGGSIASAAGGFEVPSDQMAQLHKNEMVLPANIAQGLKQMITSGGAGGGDGSSFHTHYHVTAIDAKGVKSFLQKHGREHAQSLGEQARRFVPALRPA